MKQKTKILLVVLCIACLALSMIALAANEVQGSGTNVSPFIIDNTTVGVYYNTTNQKLHLKYDADSTEFSQSYISTTDSYNTNTPPTAQSLTIKTLYVVGETVKVTKRLMANNSLPDKNATPSIVVVGGDLHVVGGTAGISNSIKGDTTTAVGGKLTCTGNAAGNNYVSGEFAEINGKVIPYNDLTTGGNAVIQGQKERMVKLTITGNATISGYFDSLTIQPGGKVTVSGDTYINSFKNNDGVLILNADVTLYMDSKSVKPSVTTTFDTTHQWGTLQKGSYENATGGWQLSGDVTINETSSIFNTDANAKQNNLTLNAAQAVYTATVNKGEVKVIHGNVVGGGDVALKINNTTETVTAYGTFSSISFLKTEDSKILPSVIVPTGKSISAVVSEKVNGTETDVLHAITVGQETTLGSFGDKLPETEGYVFTGVKGTWEVTGEGQTVQTDDTAGASLTVSGSDNTVSGLLNELNAAKPVTLNGDTRIGTGSFQIMGSADSALTVDGGEGSLGGSFKSLTVNDGKVDDKLAAIVINSQSGRAVNVNGGSVTFQNKDTTLSASGSSMNVVTVNVTGGELLVKQGHLSSTGDYARTVNVDGNARFYLGVVGAQGADAPVVDCSGIGGHGVHVENGECWLYACEIIYHNKNCIGIYVKGTGIVHLYANDPYGEQAVTAPIIHVHGDKDADAAMLVDEGGSFELRGRGILLEQPENGRYALGIDDKANVSRFSEPLSGGCFNGKVFYDGGDLFSLMPDNHYLRYDGNKAKYGYTNGSYGIMPKGSYTDMEKMGSYEDTFNTTYSDTFGVLGTYYTVTDAEWELRQVVKYGDRYQLPAGMRNAVLTLDANVFWNAEKMTKFQEPVWGMGKMQYNLQITKATTLFLCGRTLEYTGKNTDGAQIADAYSVAADMVNCLLYVKTGRLTVIDDKLNGGGLDPAVSGSGLISFSYDLLNAGQSQETAVVRSQATFTMYSGTLQNTANSVSSGVIVEGGSTRFGVTEENINNQLITVLGGIVEKTVDSQALHVTGGTATVYGGVFGTTGTGSYGGGEGITVTGGNLMLEGGLVLGNSNRGRLGVALRVNGGTAYVHGGCLYGNYKADSNNAYLSVKLESGNVYLNIDEAHKFFTTDKQALNNTGKVHHLQNVQVLGGKLVMGADSVLTGDFAEQVRAYTHNNGTLYCEAGETILYDGVIVGETAVYGAASGTAFTTKILVRDGDYGPLKIANADGNTSAYSFCNTGAATEFQNLVRIHGGTFESIDVSGLTLSSVAGLTVKAGSVQRVVAFWSKNYDFDGDNNKEWAPFNHYAELVTLSRDEQGVWAEAPENQTGIVTDSLTMGASGKAVVIRNALKDMEAWCQYGGTYTLAVNIWVGEDGNICKTYFDCNAGLPTATPLTLAEDGALEMNSFGIYGSQTDALLHIPEKTLSISTGKKIGAFSNRIRNFSTDSTAAALESGTGTLALVGAKNQELTVQASKCVISAGSFTGEYCILGDEKVPAVTALTTSGTAVLRSSSIYAATGIDAAEGTLEVEDSTIYGSTTGVKADNQSVLLTKVTVKPTDAKALLVTGSGNVTVKGNSRLDGSANVTTTGDVVLENSSIGKDYTQNGGTLTAEQFAFEDTLTLNVDTAALTDCTVSKAAQTAGDITLTDCALNDSYTQTSGKLTASGSTVAMDLSANVTTATLTDVTVTGKTEISGEDVSIDGDAYKAETKLTGTKTLNVSNSTIAKLTAEGGEVKLDKVTVQDTDPTTLLVTGTKATLTDVTVTGSGDVTTEESAKLDTVTVSVDLTVTAPEAALNSVNVTGDLTVTAETKGDLSAVKVSGNMECTIAEATLTDVTVTGDMTLAGTTITVTNGKVSGKADISGDTVTVTGSQCDSEVIYTVTVDAAVFTLSDSTIYAADVDADVVTLSDSKIYELSADAETVTISGFNKAYETATQVPLMDLNAKNITLNDSFGGIATLTASGDLTAENVKFTALDESADRMILKTVTVEGTLTLQDRVSNLYGGSYTAVVQNAGDASMDGVAADSFEQKAGTMALRSSVIPDVQSCGAILFRSGSYDSYIQLDGTADLTGGTFKRIETKKTDAVLSDIIPGNVTDSSETVITLVNNSYVLLNHTALYDGEILDTDETGEKRITVKGPFLVNNAETNHSDYTGGTVVTTSYYNITILDSENGKVTADEKTAAKDKTVTLTITPEEGYVLGSLSVSAINVSEIEVTKDEENQYSFKMPGSDVEIEAVFEEEPKKKLDFVDVEETSYYYDAVRWAVENKITTGMTETEFGPMATTTRAQMVTFLWRAAGSPIFTNMTAYGPASDPNPFEDVDKGDYCYHAVIWAYQMGITKGCSDESHFDPDAPVTRAQAVTFMARMMGVQDDAQGYQNGFVDVESSDYFANAVQWAVENGITKGDGSEDSFNPDGDCLRSQTVTFLYRWFGK